MKHKLLSMAIIMIISVPGMGFPAGKFYGVAVPSHVLSIPFTSSIIIHDGKEEILILQAAFENGTHGEEIKDFGWIIPLPEEPELSTLDHVLLYEFQYFLRDLTYRTDPRCRVKCCIPMNPIPSPIPSVVIFSAMCLSLIFFALFLIRLFKNFSRTKERRRCLWTVLALSAWLFFIAIGNYEIWEPSPIPTASLSPPKPLRIGPDKYIGDHVVKVLRPGKIRSLLNWLDEYDYRYDKRDKAVFQEYADRGWCFAAVRISPKHLNSAYYSRNGMLKPLIFCFRSSRPIYPLALGGNRVKSMELIVYVFCEHRVQTDGRLPVNFAGPFELPDRLKSHFIKSPPFWMEDRFEKIKFLTKFNGKLRPEQMKTDLIFDQAPDNSSHKETVSVEVTREDLEALGRRKFFYSRILPLIVIALIALTWERRSRKKLKTSAAKKAEIGHSNDHKGESPA